MAIRSHKTPRAYLQRFATTAKRGKGKLWVYEQGREPRIGTPKGEGAERGFFTAKVGAGLDDQPWENWAQKIEDRALDVLKRAANPCFVWSERQRVRFSEYWALLFSRASAEFEFHKRFWQKSLVDARQRISSDQQVRQQLAIQYSRLARRPVDEQEVVRIFSRIIPNLDSEAEMRHAYMTQLQRRTCLLADLLLKKPWQV